MDIEKATTLMENLLERARRADEKTFLTTREVEALGVVLQCPEETEPAPKGRSTVPVQLLTVPTIIAADIPPKMMLCIDFGTSFSKAFACIDTKGPVPDVVDLPIGYHTNPNQPLVTPSEMIIDDGMIYIGGHARKVFDDMQAAPVRLIDSFKQYITLGADVTNLAKVHMDRDKDPEQKFFQRDILVIYLAHLTRLTENALEEKNYPKDVRRRFAHPAWNDSIQERNEQEMRKMMAEAIVLARSLGDQLLKSLPTADARAALDEMKLFEGKLPYDLIAEPVREATAAGAGALLGSGENKRETYLIVDVGAGTTDVAGCICVNNPQWDRPRVFEVFTAGNAINSAGNVLDSALQRFVLDKSHLASGSAEYNSAAAFLSRSKRTNKEQLFRSDEVYIELPTGEIVHVTLEEFLRYKPVVSFSKQVRELVTNAALAAAGDAARIGFVATGGGARLPIIQQIAEEGVDCNGRHISFDWREPAPAGLTELYPDLSDPYPQIAVALGGALPFLPEQKGSVAWGLSKPRQIVLGPVYK